jgi:hypothetical protein
MKFLGGLGHADMLLRLISALQVKAACWNEYKMID